LTVESVDAVVIVLPALFVVVILTAGTVFCVVIVWPESFVVVSSTTVLVSAVVSKADVFFVTVLPASLVVVIVTETMTPVWVVWLAWVWVWVLVAVSVSVSGGEEVLVSGGVLCAAECELRILEIEDRLNEVAAAASPSGAETED
jgi:hypothetical protein